MKRKLLFLIPLLTCIYFSLSAQISVSGKVTDPNGGPMQGVSVLVKGTQIGTSTNANGVFSLENVPSASSVLVFTFIGFSTEEVTVGNKTNINVVLSTGQSAMDTLVVVGYGTAKKTEFTGSATTVSANIINAQANTTVTRALEGVVPGLQVSAIDGQPGLDMGIRLRGVSSTSQNSSNALIVIDGVPALYPNELASINPKDIESVTILKDAASTAIYGSRGASGVVMVTTKKGKSGKAKISYSTRMGFNYLPGTLRPDLIHDAKDFYEYTWLAIYNSARYGVGGNSSTNGTFTTNFKSPNMSHEDAALFASQHLFDYNGSMNNFGRNALGNWMLYNVPGATYVPTGSGTNASATMTGAYLVNTDGKLNPDAKLLFPAGSYDDYFIKKPFRQEHNLSASGGTDRMDYFLSLGLQEDPSYITGSSFKRYNFRSKVNAQLTSWLKVGGNTSFAHRNTQSPATRFGRNPGTVSQNVFRWVNSGNPLVSLFARDQNGNIVKNADGTNKVVDNQGQSYSPLGPTTNQRYAINLPKLLDQDVDRNVSNDLNLQGYATITFLKDFSFTANLAFDRFSEMRTRYGNLETGQAQGVGALAKLTNNTNVLNSQQLLNWNKDLGLHSLSALAGHEYYQWNNDIVNFTSAYSLINEFLGAGNFTSRYNTAGAPFGVPGIGGDLFRMESYFGRVNYNYNRKYFLEGSARRDGSSKFRRPEDRWGTFWSAGLGWLMSEENFMEATRGWLDELKVRASYGVIGNEGGIGNYSGYQIWSFSANYAPASNGVGIPQSFNLSQGALPNSTLTWENTHTFDAGIDFALFNHRLNGSIDYYNKLTVNAVFGNPLPYSMGQTLLVKNNAQIANRGFEIELNGDIIRNKNWRWNVGITGTHYRTILAKVPDGVGVPQLDGKHTGTVDGWAKSGGATTPVPVYLRGEGMDYYNTYLYIYKGVDPNSGLPLFQHTVTQTDHDNGRFTSDAIGANVNTVDYRLANRYETGSALPKWIGGLTTALYYKNFDLSAVLAYQFGGKFFSVSYANGYYRSGEIDGGLSRELLNNTFTADRPNAKFPMLFYQGDANYTGGSTIGSWAYTDMSLFNAGYLNIKNISLGYNLNGRLIRNSFINGLRVYASADNLALFTSHSGIDPRLSLVNGMEVGADYYLPMSSLSFGIDINF